jgi:DNA-binding ferritin-like protein
MSSEIVEKFVEEEIKKMESTVQGLEKMIDDCRKSGKNDTAEILESMKKTTKKEIKNKKKQFS